MKRLLFLLSLLLINLSTVAMEAGKELHKQKMAETFKAIRQRGLERESFGEWHSPEKIAEIAEHIDTELEGNVINSVDTALDAIEAIDEFLAPYPKDEYMLNALLNQSIYLNQACTFISELTMDDIDRLSALSSTMQAFINDILSTDSAWRDAYLYKSLKVKPKIFGFLPISNCVWYVDKDNNIKFESAENDTPNIFIQQAESLAIEAVAFSFNEQYLVVKADTHLYCYAFDKSRNTYVLKQDIRITGLDPFYYTTTLTVTNAGLLAVSGSPKFSNASGKFALFDILSSHAAVALYTQEHKYICEQNGAGHIIARQNSIDTLLTIFALDKKRQLITTKIRLNYPTLKIVGAYDDQMKFLAISSSQRDIIAFVHYELNGRNIQRDLHWTVPQAPYRYILFNHDIVTPIPHKSLPIRNNKLNVIGANYTHAAQIAADGSIQIYKEPSALNERILSMAVKHLQTVKSSPEDALRITKHPAFKNLASTNKPLHTDLNKQLFELLSKKE